MGMVIFCLFILLCWISFCSRDDNSPVKGPYPSRGLATWYNPKHTASGEMYRKDDLTCAMRTRDFGKYYLVCNTDNHECVAVRHNDFGPAHYLFREGRIIDLSRYAFSKIAPIKEGVIPVRIGEIYSAQTD